MLSRKLSAWLACAMVGCTGSGTVTGIDDAGGVSDGMRLAVQQVVAGLDDPVFLTQPPGDDRLFVVEQAGRVRTIENGLLAATPFLDITDLVQSGGERGLLSVAFHPDFPSDARLFANFTAAGSLGAGLRTRVVQYTWVVGQAQVDLATGVDILEVVQPFSNHNGGLLEFGPDGMLYVGFGDGGSGGDPLGHGQNPATLLGSILRIDVDAPDPGRNYGIPADNPFVDDATARDEIWSYGLRNPWRFAFDEIDGLLFVADVGQDRLEEITVVPANQGGLNFGWNIMEGTTCFNATSCDRQGLELPAVEYDNTGFAGNCSITGGYVYRGIAIPEVQGHYFYSDFCGGFVRSFRYDAGEGEATQQTDWRIDAGSVTSFGLDAAGEIYLLVAEGSVLRLVAQ